MTAFPEQLKRLGAPLSFDVTLPELQKCDDFDAILGTMSALPDGALAKPGCAEVFFDLAKQGHHSRRVMAADPEVIADIAERPSATAVEDMVVRLADDCRAAPGESAVLQVLRRFKQRESLRIFLREVRDPDSVRQTSAEIADLAQACIDVAIQELAQRRAKPELADLFCVLGMGKLGGRELNFSSDVDLIFIAADDAFERIADLEAFARDLTGWLDRNTDDGYVFRVDLRLRPEGGAGALVPTVSTARAYYEAWGRTWERSALIKARPIAGNLELGEALLRDLEPFLYRRYLDYQAIDELRAMKDMIHRNAEASALVGFDSPSVLDQKPAQAPMRSRLQAKMQMFGAPSTRRPATPAPAPAVSLKPNDDTGILGWDVKIGVGGIREIEFFVQALQLVHCGTRPGLRVRNTMDALDRLLFAGLMTHDDHAALSDAYAFLRALEHRIQMEQDRQGHRLPSTDTHFAQLAARFGESTTTLRDTISTHRRVVRGMFDRLFTDSEQRPESPTIQDAADVDVDTILGADIGSIDTPEIHEMLTGLGFERPRQVAGQLLILRQKTHGPFSERANSVDRTFARYLLVSCAGAPNPDQAFSHLTRFVTLVGDRPGYFRMLAEHPHASRLLIHVFGSSPYLSAALLREPAIVERLLGVGSVAVLRSIPDLRSDVQERMARIEDPEHRIGVIRRFHQEETLRIGLHDYGGAATIVQTNEQLSNLAEVVVQAVLDEVYEPLRTRKRRDDYLLPPLSEIPFSVVAMGKLGGRELSFGSDLDLLFVYEYDRQWRLEHSFFAKIAQRLVRTLSSAGSDGKMYEVDTRLRPSGQQGALVVSLEQLDQYHAESSALWERQALVRARPLTGPKTLRAAIQAVRDREVFERGLDGHSAQELQQMLERVRASQYSPSVVDIKYSPGALMDIEFAVQALQMRYAAAYPALKVTRTADVLRALTERPPIAVDFATLSKLFERLRSVEARLRMTDLRGVSAMPTEPRALAILARRLGLIGDDVGATLDSEIRQILKHSQSLVQTIFEKIHS